MVSTLKVTKIQVPNSDSDVISLDASSGNITVPKPVTFSGTVTGTAMVKLLDATISSSVSYYDIDSTYINSTYDDYFLMWRLSPTVDNRNLQIRFNQGGSVDTGNNYGVETYNMVANTGVSSNATSAITIAQSGVGNATGEHTSGYLYLRDVNDTVVTTTVNGQYNIITNTGNPTGGNISGGQVLGARTNAVTGIRLLFNSDDIASDGVIKLYGVQK